ncbi:multi-copper polyphenol oxidoreductase [Xylella fastidiosa subsp. pauca]|uniref:peptidoglycan editing factor PgeF n=1 Tax=Xylella fastidiosa TaxID=2371 RepID=UPI000582CBA1|nr:peptidoglycan editing factor PgeF [Xylella fastidiosa]ARO69281.1 multi-copper polyphenol oxidoreductase [Xylella fastidiosa subsp. pauca]KIA58786.1 laccase [Xylella fastidiosa]KXB10964.1 laccase [Xylella fastidiosa]KXB14039.1 laccase [Xylella fastidiosa]KXB16193.1 laccase [Xylella fastidiosa]
MGRFPSWVLVADWPAPPGVMVLSTLRGGPGVSVAPFDRLNLGNCSGVAGDAPVCVERNRSRLVEMLGLPSAPHWLRQVHGVEVLRVDALPQSIARVVEPTADAAVTSVAGVVLAILTADCLPVVLAAVDGSEIGVVHAGWRGLADDVLERTVAALRTSPECLQAWLGPAAGPQAYEVGVDVYAAFVERDSGAAFAFSVTCPGHWYVDLYALARQRLMRAGLSAVSIYGGGLCTISDPQRFFSHRRDRRSGRFATLAWIGC